MLKKKVTQYSGMVLMTYEEAEEKAESKNKTQVSKHVTTFLLDFKDTHVNKLIIDTSNEILYLRYTLVSSTKDSSVMLV